MGIATKVTAFKSTGKHHFTKETIIPDDVPVYDGPIVLQEALKCLNIERCAGFHYYIEIDQQPHWQQRLILGKVSR